MNRLTNAQVKELMKRRLIDPHDLRDKLGGSKQDYYVDKSTGELHVALKYGASHFEPLGIIPRDLGIPKF